MIQRFTWPALAVGAVVLTFASSAQAQQRKATGSSATRSGSSGTGNTAPAPASTRPASTPARAPEPDPVATKPEGPAASAPSAPTGEHVRFGIAGGLAAPMSSLGKAFSAGYNVGGFLEGRPTGFPVGLRGDIQYAHFGGKNNTVTPSYSVIQLTGAGVYQFPSGTGTKSPFFASAGLGLYRSSAAGESQTDFGQNLGLGFNFKAKRFAPFVEGRFHFFNDVQYFSLSAALHL